MYLDPDQIPSIDSLSLNKYVFFFFFIETSEILLKNDKNICLRVRV